ncbi:MAG: DinB family protein [Phycisphaeraceae bacterium]|nr:DinB family protein [Phycisphaeraceae bacterium]
MGHQFEGRDLHQQKHYIAQTIIPGAKRSHGYAQTLLPGIDPKAANLMPKGVKTNHPTFVYGHLSIYPDKLFPMLGRPDLVKGNPARYDELFSPYAECEHDPEGTKYPSLDEVAAHYNERTSALIEFLGGVNDEVLASANPGPMKEMFPTIGSQVAFMLQAHTMMHLGQVSAWRRVMGLGEAMPRPKKP